MVVFDISGLARARSECIYTSEFLKIFCMRGTRSYKRDTDSLTKGRFSV